MDRALHDESDVDRALHDESDVDKTLHDVRVIDRSQSKERNDMSAKGRMNPAKKARCVRKKEFSCN